LPKCRFVEAGLSTWVPAERTDLLFGNAVFQWVPDHPAALRRLLESLPAGGTLAVQMPDNTDEPALALMREVAGRGPWAKSSAVNHAARDELPRPGTYYDLLRPLCSGLDIWHTIYNHVMADHAAIVEWFKGSALRPFLSALDPAAHEKFIGDYMELIERHYPARCDGKVLLPFPRLFIVAVR
jgi:trans-aconitate 2-methyltransferase